MPIPAIVAVVGGLSAAVAAAYQAIPDGAKKIGREEFYKLFDGGFKHWEGAALQAAFESIGLPGIDPEEGLTPASITRAINEGPLAGTGVELRNLFDKQACKEDMLKIGLQRATQSIGFDVESPTVQGFQEAMRKWVSSQVKEQIEAGGGPLIDNAPDLSEIVRAIRSGMKGWQEDGAGGAVQEDTLDPSPKAAQNRERQARYRGSHERQWEHLLLGAGHSGD